MKKVCLLITLALGLSLALTLLWILGASSSSAAAAPIIGHIKGPNAPVAELHVCPSGCTYSSIQAAVDAASDGDVIKVAAGTYTGVSERNGVTQMIYLSKTLTIQGGYTTSNWTTPDPEANLTTLDALGEGRVFYVTGAISPTIEGLHITGGDATGLGGTWWGWDAGGGIFVVSATATISNNWIYDNTAGEGSTLGGGVCLMRTYTTLFRNTIFGNTAATGGGITELDGHATLSHNTILSNTASLDGGGLALWDGDGTVGVVTGNTISGNTAHDQGGGILMGAPGFTVINNVVTDNSADVSGSGLCIDRSGQLWHTTVARNTGGDGSGIFVMANASAGPFSVAFTNTILVEHSVGISVTGGNTITVNGILWHGTPITVSQGSTATVVVHNQTIGNPAFSADGYHLTAGSAAIDKGVDAGVTVDIDGQPRPAGMGYDLGADELLYKVYLPLVVRNYQP